MLALLLPLACSLLTFFAEAGSSGWPQDVSEQTFVTQPSGENFHYFISNAKISDNVTSALIVMHGHPRDVGKTLTAALMAARNTPAASQIPVIAPLFQVSDAQSVHCRSAGLPAALPEDALWNCHSWLDGGPDVQNRLSAFSALDQLLAHLKQRWPSLRQVTVAGFSAGGQFVQHYVAFARPPVGMRMRYVIADPGSWLWFDPRALTTCPQINQWKYGLEKVPLWLDDRLAGARERYRNADVRYLEGGDDRGSGPGSYLHILDKSCAANSQGRYRLDRGIRYARYDSEVLKPVIPHPLEVAAGCRHDVLCVFPSQAGRQALFTPAR
ncbi:hypothetical protein EHW64_02395 [Erwinia psidii]|uniref:Alpha/beta hydrolase n=1 Tax=Erwinia psidii TaxID=69224 RepID=A0A3N6S1E9_9GAMM|nr:hypothetical protein [Erwinia psidii]MCX8960061.1 hypothetical protein [Erwinia psidii]RQM39364.1 hypothetical protein EB241_05355 [Erwinia psidii]